MGVAEDVGKPSHNCSSSSMATEEVSNTDTCKDEDPIHDKPGKACCSCFCYVFFSVCFSVCLTTKGRLNNSCFLLFSRMPTATQKAEVDKAPGDQ